MKRHVTCFVEKAGFEPRTLGTKAERSIKILALNNTVMDLTADRTKQEIRCEFVHHQLGVLPKLPLPLQVDELERLIERMCGMTQQASNFWIAEYDCRFSYSSSRGSQAARALVWHRMQQSWSLNRRAPLPL
jgi:hypothetical protein